MPASAARSSGVSIGERGGGIPASSSRSKFAILILSLRSRYGRGSVRLRSPGAALAGRRRFEGAADLIDPALSLEVKSLGSVRDLELQMVAADESFDRRGAIAGQMDIQLAVQEAVGLRAESKLHLGIAAASKTTDGAGRDRRPEHAAGGPGCRVGRRAHRGADSAATTRTSPVSA